jgi:small GTP-binding protein
LIQKKVCLIGAYGAGKTSLVRRYVDRIFDERYHTTVGVRIDRKEVSVAGTDVLLVIWDLAGDDEFSRIKPFHVRGAAGFIFVVDGCRRYTLQTAIDLRRSLIDDLGPVPFVVAVNKRDLEPEWEVDAGLAREFAGDASNLFLTSAKTGEGVEAMFERTAIQVLGSLPA